MPSGPVSLEEVSSMAAVFNTHAAPVHLVLSIIFLF